MVRELTVLKNLVFLDVSKLSEVSGNLPEVSGNFPEVSGSFPELSRNVQQFPKVSGSFLPASRFHRAGCTEGGRVTRSQQPKMSRRVGWHRLPPPPRQVWGLCAGAALALLRWSQQKFYDFNHGAPGAAEGRSRFRTPECSTLISAHPAGGWRAYQSSTLRSDKRASAGGFTLISPAPRS